MAITSTWKVTGLKVKNFAKIKPNAVIVVYWQVIGTDENNNQGIYYGETSFTIDPTDNSGPFIPFEELTEEDVINWINLSIADNEKEYINQWIQQKIDDQINPMVDMPLPWVNNS